MVMGSPYEPAKQTIFYIGAEQFDAVIIKINPNVSTHDAIQKIETIYKTYAPSSHSPINLLTKNMQKNL